jgi:hypothetical protein
MRDPFVESCQAKIAELQSYLASLEGAGGSARLRSRPAGARDWKDSTPREIESVKREIAALEAAIANHAGV